MERDVKLHMRLNNREEEGTSCGRNLLRGEVRGRCAGHPLSHQQGKSGNPAGMALSLTMEAGSRCERDVVCTARSPIPRPKGTWELLHKKAEHTS